MPSGKYLNLRAKPFRESDLLIDALSKEGERLTFSAKNAVKSQKRFSGGVLEPLNFIEVHFTESKAGYLYIQEAKLLYGFPGLRDNYQKLETAFYFSKLISKATREGLEDNRSLFDLMGNSLKALEESADIPLLRLQFELKYLFYLGFLALDKDTEEFVSKPIRSHTEIQLTDDEFTYLSQSVSRSLKQMDLMIQDESL